MNDVMIHQAPAGARDWLPLEVVQKRWVTDRLQRCFESWGYQQIVTSTLEWLDTLVAGGAIEPATVIQVPDRVGGGTLGLRPELTASIARAAVSRLTDIEQPHRLYYQANVFRRTPSSHGSQVEFYQAGVELLGAGSPQADAEVLFLLADCLQTLGLPQWHLVLGDAGLTRSLLATFPVSQQPAIRHCVAHLDRIGLAALDLVPEQRDRALKLFDLRGQPATVLAQLTAFDLDDEGRASVARLQTLTEVLATAAESPLPFILDLSLLQTIDYYTGLVFEVVAQTEGSLRALGQGGRYDRLLGLYDPKQRQTPGIGFALNLEELHACLLDLPQLPQVPPTSHWLVAPKTPAAAAAAFAFARQTRAASKPATVRVELELDERAPDAIRAYATQKGIERLAWVAADGSVEEEALLGKWLIEGDNE
ncbi:MAG: ATP phosphoribosyltransferase regulatory subunit [Cyanobacteria bacterium J06641_5]